MPASFLFMSPYSIGFLTGAAAVLAVWFGCAYQRKHDLSRYFAALERARKNPPRKGGTRNRLKGCAGGSRAPTGRRGGINNTTMSLTTDPNSPCLRNIEPSGQQTCYLVLSEEERAKGFVRPVRKTYVHTGRKVCGKIQPPDGGRLGGELRVCCLEPGHTGECWEVSQKLPQPQAARAEHEHLIGGCGTTTTMGRALAETYARDPKFYGGTFCCNCGSHFPVGERGEFEWGDGSAVGS
jgi:hypothetical protein